MRTGPRVDGVRGGERGRLVRCFMFYAQSTGTVIPRRCVGGSLC